MPFKVSCPACASRFALSDELYRRRVAGSFVKVKCRNCNAEIAVDATEPITMPNHEAPRTRPIPSRSKAGTQLGLGVPPAPAERAASSPLPLDPTHSPLPLNAVVTPRPTIAAAATPLSAEDPDSSWSDEPTIAINLADVKPPARLPVARPPIVTPAEELELVDAVELPVSSSDAPTLDALTLEAGGAHVPHGKPAPDQFLVGLSAGKDGILGTIGDGALGAPTIDVTSLAADLNPPSVDVALRSEEAEFDYRPARAGTIPLFDMGAVLPAASSGSSKDSAASVALAGPSMAAADRQLPEPRARERKFVIAPDAPEAEAEAPKSRRSVARLWVGALLAAAAALVVVAGSREFHWFQPSSTEPPLALTTQPVVTNQAALPAETHAAEPSEAASVAPTASAAAPAVQNVAVGTTLSVPPSVPAAVKSNAQAFSNETEKPRKVVEPAAPEPVVADNPIEAHDAPTPAAPDAEFDRDAARNALATASTQASSCRKEGDPSGTASLTITFAPSGRVTSAQVEGPPFAGTATGGCIATAMRRASVPAFSGDYVTVSKSIVIQ